MTQNVKTEQEIKSFKTKGHIHRAFDRLIRKKLAVGCLVILGIIYLSGITVDWISPYGYTDQDYTQIRQSPNSSHWLGTDRAGRDVFTRVLWGIQNTLILTFVGMLTGGLILGVTMGLVSGYFGGYIDAIIQRSGEVVSSIPTFFLILIISATVRPRIIEFVRWVEDNSFLEGLVRGGIVDYFVISLYLVIFGLIGSARLVRGQILYLKETQFIDAARSIGVSTPNVLFRHLLPNAISPLIVTVTMGMGSMIGAEIFLSWIGLGIQPPRPSLGVMLWESGNISVIRTEPWLMFAPGSVAFLMVLAWNLLGDALNDVFNPRTY